MSPFNFYSQPFNPSLKVKVGELIREDGGVAQCLVPKEGLEGKSSAREKLRKLVKIRVIITLFTL